ncbi:MAG: phosphoribosylformylglycinamidine cyclo-ligase [Calditrichaeota bacterium]|nr:MAG: phosphoribosylformylglycinamidine cyclo-ligase [Calditrichota bacterium]MBL1204194.1 phosphoribosylformylglycinamidine cyclo-ligase [Calditrichota bacterium]NOG44024.1 phosphoribosylformylglycinamidine cyclo-ligase [Calditrichota bacterium]
MTYKDSGVDIKKGERAVSDVKSMIKSTFTPNVLGSIGGFGGLFEVPQGYKKPVLVSSTDGVGTKLSVAVKAGKHDTVGEDLVNHCINDIAVLGAKPLYFLDYFGTANLDEQVFNNVISGFVRGCKNSEVALVGGETAEMPGIYHDKDYDLCGTIVGIIEKDQIVTGEKIQKGDKLIGIASNGMHTNGYSLARKVLFQSFEVNQHIDDLGCTLAEELLRVHKCYLGIIQSSLNKYNINGISHITGGGIIGNTKRILPEGLSLSIDWESWDSQPVFELIQKTGSVPTEDMRNTFNLGIGLILIVPENQSLQLQNEIKMQNEKAWIIGEIV